MGISKILITFIATTSPLLIHPAAAAVISCSTADVTVSSATVESAAIACVAVQQAAALFETCGVPPLTDPLRIDILDDLEAGYIGQYHIGKDKIEVLSPPALQDRWNAEGAFSDLDTSAYFKSAVTHELTHAAIEDIPCPFASCIATNEYIAYAMQIRSLDPVSLSAFEATSRIDRLISTDELSSAIMFLAPNLFAQKIWAHFQQRDEGCDFIGQLVRGEKFIDRNRF